MHQGVPFLSVVLSLFVAGVTGVDGQRHPGAARHSGRADGEALDVETAAPDHAASDIAGYRDRTEST